jgi:hypothetical protein
MGYHMSRMLVGDLHKSLIFLGKGIKEYTVLGTFGWDGRGRKYLLFSLKYKQKDATFSRSIYFYKLLYMFQAVSPPIVRSIKLYIRRQVLSNQYCCLLLSWMRWK